MISLLPSDAVSNLERRWLMDVMEYKSDMLKLYPATSRARRMWTRASDKEFPPRSKKDAFKETGHDDLTPSVHIAFTWRAIGDRLSISTTSSEDSLDRDMACVIGLN